MRRCLVLVLMVGPLVTGCTHKAAKPWETWQPPPVAMPQPNAYDTYLKAFALKAQIDERLGVALPYAASGEPSAIPTRLDQWCVGPASMPLVTRVAAYQGVLTLARQALKQKCRILDNGNTFVGPRSDFRSIEYLLAIESEVRRQRHDTLGAANSALDGLAVAQAAMTQRGLPGFLVGWACEAMVLAPNRPLNDTVPVLTAPECRTVLSRLLQLEETRPPLTAMLAGHRVRVLTSLKTLLVDPAEQDKALAKCREQSPRAAREFRRALRGMKAASWQEFGQFWETERQYASLPYLRRPQPGPEPADATNFFVRNWAWPIRSPLRNDARNLAWLRQRELQLAVRAYLLEHRRLPQGLMALVPSYLPHVPADPFGEGPMKSVATADGLAVYSIGPDGIDDGGKPVSRWVRPDEKGDMVVVIPKGS